MGEDGKIVYKVVIDDKGVQTEAEQAGQRAGDSFGKGAGTMEQVWTGAARRIGEAFTNMAISAAKSAGKLLTGSIQTGMDFDAAMSQVAATMGWTTKQLEDSTSVQAQQFQALRDFAREMGRTTIYNAEEAANALNYMALAGYDAETSMKMLPTVLNLAVAGSMDLARASDVVTDIQSALGLSIEDTITMVDQMARAAQVTNTSVEQLGEGMLTVGGLAKNLRGGTAELATILGVLASNGIKSTEGGTHLRNILSSLSAPTEGAAKRLDALGVSLFDDQGKMRNMADFLGDLKNSFADLTQQERLEAIGDIFNVRDIASAEALLGFIGNDWENIAAQIQASEDAAQSMVDIIKGNLKGDIKQLDSAWYDFKVELSDKFTPILREIIPKLTEMVYKLIERLQNADWSRLGDQILTIADKLMQLLGYIIDNADKIGNVFSTIGGALLLGKGAGAAKGAWDTVSGLFGGAKAATGASAAAAPAAQASAAATAATGGWGALALPFMELLALGKGTQEYFSARSEALKNATLGDEATIEQLRANVETQRQLVEDAKAFYNSREFELYAEGTWEPEDGWRLSEATAQLDAAQAALAAAERELADREAQMSADAQTSGEDAMASYADGITIGADKWLIPALATTAGLFSAYFHHSEPDVGPMADDADWMPDMMQGWARQIRDYAPELSGALSLALPTRADFERSVSVNIAARGNIGARAIENTIVLNGREIARATAWDMGEQLAWEEM